MSKSRELNPESFEGLLQLFSSDREEAGLQHEQMRLGLVRFFYFRGCTDPEMLADETMTRVAIKADKFDSTQRARLGSYFYGFATNVLMESRRAAKRELPLTDNQNISYVDETDSDKDDARGDCLQKCLERLPTAEREMIVNYYAFEGEKKSATRSNLCERFSYSPGALYTKIFRIRADLRICIGECIKAV